VHLAVFELFALFYLFWFFSSFSGQKPWLIRELCKNALCKLDLGLECFVGMQGN